MPPSPKARNRRGKEVAKEEEDGRERKKRRIRLEMHNDQVAAHCTALH
jgi:hypothetical protein